ncbi:MAG: hypothetical protein ACM65L_23115 [Microcoleus sp.]
MTKSFWIVFIEIEGENPTTVSEGKIYGIDLGILWMGNFYEAPALCVVLQVSGEYFNPLLFFLNVKAIHSRLNIIAKSYGNFSDGR